MYMTGEQPAHQEHVIFWELEHVSYAHWL